MGRPPSKIPTIGPVLNADMLLWIIDHIYGNILIADGKGKILFVNQNAADTLGISREELSKMNVIDNLERGAMSRSTTLEALGLKKTVVGGFQSRTGEEYISSSTPLLDHNGNIQLVMTYSQKKSSIEMLTEAIEMERKNAENYKYALQYTANTRVGQSSLIAASTKMKDIISFAKHIASTDSTILIGGESGTGKEVLANYIKENSRRKDEPYITVNCAAIPPNLMESEFFGYTAGAFTGASKTGKPGVFEMANNGTLFLDEIGELPLELQGKLLRVLETSEFYRIGSTKNTKTNVRVITATNKDLFREVKEGRFREDLYYRINVIPCKIPPLRERKQDIIPLAEYFLELCNEKYEISRSFAPDLFELFSNHGWPGNVRELRNLVERIAVSSVHPLVTVASLRQNPVFAEFPMLMSIVSETEEHLTEAPPSSAAAVMPIRAQGERESIGDYYKRLEQERVVQAMLTANGNKSKAAKLLGISTGKLYRLLEKM